MGVNNTFSTSLTGMNGLQTQLDIVANNVSNSNTTGYKTQQASFSELLNKDITEDVTEDEQPLAVNMGVKVTSGEADYSQGTISETGVSTDFAINGNGFFGVTDTSGNLYLTRDGDFSFDANGDLVNSQGYKVSMNATVPTNQWPSGTLNVSSNGEMSINTGTESVQVGQLAIYEPSSLSSLINRGDNLYSVATGTTLNSNLNGATDLGSIKQGALESSNVDLASEMSNLIIAQRAYSLNSQMLKSNDDMWESINSFNS
ncbi:flagellar hook basal-body protein [Ligilactobacillus sp. WILCCON 0076]|uniref:Flagellar hook basal-body protein n=1 Tax=Ligilactobacillus ubinensis TaxID=2876789 RepID=A0A9X2FHI7_9LACO|nr:flagellar hook basal-body protein [Ligilactobacillus ubinensis]MCP0886234.1 flagellar hook basal-body protein [Ligilactobacillus ubinensis]